MKATVDDGVLRIYNDAMEDVAPHNLELAFVWYEKFWVNSWLPNPGEIRAKGAELAKEEYWRQRNQAEQQERSQALESREPVYGLADVLKEAKGKFELPGPLSAVEAEGRRELLKKQAAELNGHER